MQNPAHLSPTLLSSRNVKVQLESFASLVCLAKLEILFVRFKYSPSSWMTKHIKQRFRHSASWKRIDVEYSEEWILYYNMMLRLWTDADLHKKVCRDSRKIQIRECLDLCERLVAIIVFSDWL